MSPGRIAAGPARAVRVLVALTAVSACLGAVAYAATLPERPAVGLGGSHPVAVATQGGADAPKGTAEEPLLQPRFIEFPEAVSTATEPQFRFHVPPRSQRPQPQPQPTGASGEPKPPRRFQCKLDGGGWGSCSSPYRLGDLAPGGHVFAVRAFNHAGRPGAALSYSWRQAVPAAVPAQVDPKPFAIEARGELEDLYPGYPPQPVPVLITNPNLAPIEVTSLTVAIAGDPAGCAAANFALTPSSASPTAPLAVPASGSVSLPTATVSAPAITMLNLSVNQDSCQGAEVPLVFNGEAHG
jgi:hypothetical protein